jgi:ABC-type transport system substrate-binding protein
MNAGDVKYSWDRTVALSPLISAVLRSKTESGPIDSLSTPDNNTVVLKLAFPYGGINEAMAYWYLYITPVEAEDKFSVKQEARGSGPFLLDRLDTDVKYVFKRNPDWYVKDRPFLDGIEKIVINEYAAILAQFESKVLWTFAPKADEVLAVKRRHPEMELFQNPRTGSPDSFYWSFSQKETSPFRDVRLRRAASLLLDRELYIDTFFNGAEFRNAGLPFETVWASHLAVQCVNWIDPRDKGFGEHSKWFQHNLAEAKQLISAAGNPTVDFTWRNQPGNFTDIAAVSGNMFEEGFKMNRQGPDSTEWRRMKLSGGELYDGIFFNIAHGTNDDSWLVDKYTPFGTDTISKKPLPGITDAVMKIRGELDINKQNEQIKALQKELAGQMLDVMIDNEQRAYALKWPWFKNYGLFSAPGFSNDASTGRPYTEYWYDATLKT